MTPTSVTSRERSLYSTFSERALQTRRHEIAQAQEQLGTGRAINRASDDPAGYAQGRALALLGERYGQYERSIAAARGWTDRTQQALDGLSELFTQAYEEGVRANNVARSDGDRSAIADRLDALLAEVVDSLNAKSGDEYLFAGSRSTVKPFAVDAGTGAVNYLGNDGDRTRHIGRDRSLAINIDGASLHDFGTGDTITAALQDLSTSVRAGDQVALAAALERVTDARDHVLHRGSQAGSTASRLTLADGQLREAALVAEHRRSELEDADIAEVMLRSQQQQTGLQAALKVTASVMQTSLLDYLR